jgi:hypothetical protein
MSYYHPTLPPVGPGRPHRCPAVPAGPLSCSEPLGSHASLPPVRPSGLGTSRAASPARFRDAAFRLIQRRGVASAGMPRQRPRRPGTRGRRLLAPRPRWPTEVESRRVAVATLIPGTRRWAAEPGYPLAVQHRPPGAIQIQTALHPVPPLTHRTAPADHRPTPRFAELGLMHQLRGHDHATAHLDHPGALELSPGWRS